MFKISTKEDIDAYLSKLHADFGELSKYDMTDYYEYGKENLPRNFVTSILFDIALENSKATTDNDHCVNSDPFCTSEILTFHAPANNVDENVPSIGCLGSKPYPAWFHMRINTPGKFIIHMEGRDPNTGEQRDIDFCLWGPFDNPTTPCTSQLTSNKIIDCCYSSSYSENAYLGYPDNEHHHSGYGGHGNVNYHLPQTGEYYILLITNFSQQSCRISFTKQDNSGPGTTDCSIIDPFLTANTPCVGSTLTLQADDIAGATYQWTGPDNQTHTGRTWNRTNATLSMSGTYTCHVTAGTQSGTETINAVVLPAIASVDFTYGTAIAGQEVQFTNSETTNPAGHNNQITSRTWNFGDGSTGNTINPKHTYAQPGTYQVTYTATITGGEDGVCSNYITKTVVVQSSLSANITGDDAVCQNESITLTAEITGGMGTLHYVWKQGNNTVGTDSPTLTLNMPNAGSIRFSCTVSDSNTTVTASKTVTVNALPNAYAGEDQAINYDNATKLEAEYASGYTYSWQPADSLANPAQNNTREVWTKALKGNTVFTVTVTDAHGCINQDDVVVSVGAELSATVTIDDSEICENESTTVRAQAIGGNPSDYTFSWEPANEVEYPHAESSTVYPSVNTDHYTCTISDGHTTLTKTVYITVHELPIAYAGIDFQVNYDNPATLTADEVPGATYEWFPKDKIQNGDNEHQTVTTIPLTEETEFTLRVSRNGCWTEDRITVFAGNQLQGRVEATDNNICQYDGFTVLTATAFGGNGSDSYTYLWESSKPGEFEGADSFLAVFSNPTESGEYEIKCTINDGQNSIERKTTINVMEQPQASVSVVNPNIIDGYPSVVQGGSLTLEASPVSGATYEWQPNTLIMNVTDNGRIATTYPLNELGINDFTVTVKTKTATNNYCTNSASLTVKVYEDITAFFDTSHDEICEREILNLTAHATGGTGNYRYTWSPAEYFDNNNGQSVSTKELPNMGMIKFICQVEDLYLANAYDEDDKEIIIHEAPTVNYDLVGESLVEAGNEFYPYVYEYSIDEESLKGYEISTISWDLKSYYETPNQVDPVTQESLWFCVPDPNPDNPQQPKKAYVYITEEGNAKLTCTITAACGTANARIIIYTEGYEYDDQSVYEVNYDRLISVYPNPNDGDLYIDFGEETNSPISVSIYNYYGIMQYQFKESSMIKIAHYSINGLADGLYYVRITGKDFAVTKKVVLIK